MMSDAQLKPCNTNVWITRSVQGRFLSLLLFIPKIDQLSWYDASVFGFSLFTDHFKFYYRSLNISLSYAVLNVLTSGKFHCRFSLELSLFIFSLPRLRCIYLIFVERVVL